MKIESFQYLRAVVQTGSFSEAAKSCNVSQPAISASIKTLENTLGFQIVNRDTKPLQLTPQGESLYHTALELLYQYEKILAFTSKDAAPYGTIKMGIIPTLAPYLLPIFLNDFLKQFPKIELLLGEMITAQIVKKIKNGSLDAAILVTPLEQSNVDHRILFYEELMLYSHKPIAEPFINPNKLDKTNLWLLEEGHCFREQVINLCDLKTTAQGRFKYKAGSVQSLINLVNQYRGSTVIPEMAVKSLSAAHKKKITPFDSPSPVREVSLVVHRYSPYKMVFDTLYDLIRAKIPQHMKHKEEYITLPIVAK